MCTAVEETNTSDPRSYEHHWTSGWNKVWKTNSGSYGILTHDLKHMLFGKPRNRYKTVFLLARQN